MPCPLTFYLANGTTDSPTNVQENQSLSKFEIQNIMQSEPIIFKVPIPTKLISHLIS